MIRLNDITKSFGGKPVFSHFNAEFETHSVSCILGASGVGKTTLINMVAGLTAPDSGSIFFPDEKLRASYVFQEPRLLPWLNVHDNLDLVLKSVRLPDGKTRLSKKARMAKITEQLKLVGLEADEFSPIGALSGGMVQRVSLCRAFLYPSDILFLDEPFKAQDEKLKEALYDTFFRAYAHDEKKRTVLFVTHDISEALRLADSVYVLSGSPAELAGRFDRADFDEYTAEKIKALL